MRMVWDVTEADWLMYDPEEPVDPVEIPYDCLTYYGCDCGNPSVPWCDWGDFAVLTAGDVRASWDAEGLRTGVCGFWASTKSDAQFVRTEEFEDYPEPGDTYRVDEYKGIVVEQYNASATPPCSFVVSVYSMFQAFINGELSPDHGGDPESLGHGFPGPVFFMNMEESCVEWTPHVTSAGPNADPSGHTYDATGTLTIENNDCCLEVGEGGVCVEGTANGLGYCEEGPP